MILYQLFLHSTVSGRLVAEACLPAFPDEDLSGSRGGLSSSSIDGSVPEPPMNGKNKFAEQSTDTTRVVKVLIEPCVLQRTRLKVQEASPHRVSSSSFTLRPRL
jgi:hypothetical protein